MPYPLALATASRRLTQVARHHRYYPKVLFSSKAQEAETFLSGTTSLYAEQMYELYSEDPNSVHPSWKQYFDNLDKGVTFSVDDYSRPTTIPGRRAVKTVSTRLARCI